MKNKTTSVKWTKEARQEVKEMTTAFSIELSGKSMIIAEKREHKEVEIIDVEDAMRWMIADLTEVTQVEEPIIKVVH